MHDKARALWLLLLYSLVPAVCSLLGSSPWVERQQLEGWGSSSGGSAEAEFVSATSTTTTLILGRNGNSVGAQHARHERAPEEGTLKWLQRALESGRRGDVIAHVGGVLDKVADVNDLLGKGSHRRKTPFHSTEAPAVAIRDYVDRVGRHMGKYCPSICLLIAMVYLDRLASPDSELHLHVSSLTVHRLFVSALLVAMKYIEEGPSKTVFGEEYYRLASEVTGFSPTELIHLEKDMLEALVKDTFVAHDEVVAAAGNLLRRELEVTAVGSGGARRERLVRDGFRDLPPPFQ